MLEDAVGESRKRQALQQHGSRAPQRCQEQTFPAEEHRFEVSGPFDVVVDSVSKRDETSGIDAQCFPVEFFLDDRSADMHEGFAVSLKSLQDESFSAEETSPKT